MQEEQRGFPADNCVVTGLCRLPNPRLAEFDEHLTNSHIFNEAEGGYTFAYHGHANSRVFNN